MIPRMFYVSEHAMRQPDVHLGRIKDLVCTDPVVPFHIARLPRGSPCTLSSLSPAFYSTFE